MGPAHWLQEGSSSAPPRGQGSVATTARADFSKEVGHCNDHSPLPASLGSGRVLHPGSPTCASMLGGECANGFRQRLCLQTVSVVPGPSSL